MGIAIVTGASSGLGLEFAKALDKKEGVSQIWALARHEEPLQRLKDQLQTPVMPLVMDLSAEDAPLRFQALLEEKRPQIHYLVNNAGFGKFCELEKLSMAQALSMVDVNCRAVTGLCLASLPYLAPGARILNLSSASAFQPLPYMELYAASKAFVRSFSRGLHRELRPKGVSVTAVCPYWTKTAFFDRAHAHEGGQRVTKYEVMYDPQKVVEKALTDAERGRDMSVYGLWNRTQHVAAKLLPQSLIMDIWMNRQKLPK